MTKMGGFASSVQGLCPWTPLGALPPNPRYRLVLRTRHGAPPITDPFRRLWPSPGRNPVGAPVLYMVTVLGVSYIV